MTNLRKVLAGKAWGKLPDHRPAVPEGRKWMHPEDAILKRLEPLADLAGILKTQDDPWRALETVVAAHDLLGCGNGEWEVFERLMNGRRHD